MSAKFILCKATVNKKLVSVPQRLHMRMRAGGYFIIISHYFMTSLSLVNISNYYTKIQIQSGSLIMNPLIMNIRVL